MNGLETIIIINDAHSVDEMPCAHVTSRIYVWQLLRLGVLFSRT